MARERNIAGLNQAVVKCGGKTALAALVGVTRRTIYDWLNAGGVPENWVVKVAEASGVPASTIRPDVAEAFRE